MALLNSLRISETDATESSLAGTIKSVKVGSQFVSKIVIKVIFNFKHSLTAFNSRGWPTNITISGIDFILTTPDKYFSSQTF